MKYLKQMKRLTEKFNKNVREETTIAELAELLECSERHAKTVVGYLDKKKFIDWDFKRGRGKKPKINLHFSLKEIQLEEAKQLVDLEKYQEAFTVMEKLDRPSNTEFQRYLEDFLGLVENKSGKKDVLRYPFYETDLKMDPLEMISRHDNHMVQQIFDQLVEFDPVKEEIIPKIAHHFESRDGKFWTFYLRKGVFFHDGRELTSEDVSATFERLREVSVSFKAIDSIRCVSKHVITFQLHKTDYFFPRYTASLSASIIPKDAVHKKDFSSLPIGSGAFQIVRHDNEMIRLDVFENYYGFRPWLDSVEILKAPSHFQLSAQHPIQLHAPDVTWNEVAKMEEGADFITLNCRKDGPFQEESFRKLVYELIRPEIYCLPGEKVAHSFLTEKTIEQECTFPMPVVQVNYIGDELLIAAQQIREGVNHGREAEILKQQLQQSGIPAKVELVDVADFKKQEVIAKYDLFVGGIALGEDRLLSVLSAIQSNDVRIFNSLPEVMQTFVVEHLEKIKRTTDEKTRWEYYFEIEEQLKKHHILHFLNHRSHTVYEAQDSLYVNIDLDSNGRVDYRKIWKRN